MKPRECTAGLVPKDSATLAAAEDTFGYTGRLRFTIARRGTAGKLHSVTLRVYDNDMQRYASPEVRTLKPRPC